MKSYSVLIRWTQSFGFRAGEWASIIGVIMAEPKDCKPRLCYSVMYKDGTYDSIPVSDSDNYEVKANKVKLSEIEVKLTTNFSQVAQDIRDCTEALKAWEYLTAEQEKEIIARIKILKAKIPELKDDEIDDLIDSELPSAVATAFEE